MTEVLREFIVQGGLDDRLSQLVSPAHGRPEPLVGDGQAAGIDDGIEVGVDLRFYARGSSGRA
jgi:hypothetical protein